jgi:peptidoglycan glycosyltransferase
LSGRGLEVEEMGGRIRQLARVVLGGLLVLALFLGYWQVIRAEGLQTNPLNPRLAERAEMVPRGRLLTREGDVLAETDASGHRSHPRGAMYAHLTGYDVKSGLEPGLALPLAALGPYGRAWAAPWERAKRGNDVWLTVDDAVQAAAVATLRGHRGAVVVLDPRDGAILALASAPSFDPNTATEQATWEAIRRDQEAPLLDRALRGLYPPGSTFKIVVATAALAAGVVSEDEKFQCSGEKTIGGHVVRCWKQGGHGTITFRRAVADSCNIVFAEVGERLGAKALADFVKKLPLGRQPDLPLPTEGVRWPDLPAGPAGEAELADVSYGQGRLLVTPLGMALTTAMLAEGGAAVPPRVVLKVTGEGGALVSEPPAARPTQVVSADVARRVAAMMEGVVTQGTGKRAFLPGIRVAAKTGSAQNDQGEPHAWFVAFAPVERPSVVVTIVLENAGSGGTAAAPFAKTILLTALRQKR